MAVNAVSVRSSWSSHPSPSIYFIPRGPITIVRGRALFNVRLVGATLQSHRVVLPLFVIVPGRGVSLQDRNLSRNCRITSDLRRTERFNDRPTHDRRSSSISSWNTETSRGNFWLRSQNHDLGNCRRSSSVKGTSDARPKNDSEPLLYARPSPDAIVFRRTIKDVHLPLSYHLDNETRS